MGDWLTVLLLIIVVVLVLIPVVMVGRLVVQDVPRRSRGSILFR